MCTARIVTIVKKNGDDVVHSLLEEDDSRHIPQTWTYIVVHKTALWGQTYLNFLSFFQDMSWKIKSINRTVNWYHAYQLYPI